MAVDIGKVAEEATQDINQVAGAGQAIDNALGASSGSTIKTLLWGVLGLVALAIVALVVVLK